MDNTITFLTFVMPGYLDGVLKNGVGDIVLNAGPMVQFVLLILIIFSVVSWAIIFDKFRVLRRADRESKEFLDFFWKAKTFPMIFGKAKKMDNSPLATVFRAGYLELSKLAQAKADAIEKGNAEGLSEISTHLIGVDNVSRALRQAVTAETTRVEKSLPFLATTGNTSPFIGLFGTVWGIMNAFRGIGIKGSASLAVVAPGISEALIATAAGLAVAIPAVVAYNYYLNKTGILASDMERFSSEFLNIVEKHFGEK